MKWSIPKPIPRLVLIAIVGAALIVTLFLGFLLAPAPAQTQAVQETPPAPASDSSGPQPGKTNANDLALWTRPGPQMGGESVAAWFTAALELNPQVYAQGWPKVAEALEEIWVKPGTLYDYDNLSTGARARFEKEWDMSEAAWKKNKANQFLRLITPLSVDPRPSGAIMMRYGDQAPALTNAVAATRARVVYVTYNIGTKTKSGRAVEENRGMIAVVVVNVGKDWRILDAWKENPLP